MAPILGGLAGEKVGTAIREAALIDRMGEASETIVVELSGWLTGWGSVVLSRVCGRIR